MKISTNMNALHYNDGLKRLHSSLIILFVGFTVFLTGINTVNAQNNNSPVNENTLAQLVNLQGNSDSNMLSIQFTNVTIQEALKLLADEINVGFSFNPGVIPDKKVSFSMSNVPPHEVIYRLLEGTNLEPVLPPSKDVIVIREKEPIQDGGALQQIITGTVVDAQSGELLPGVNVIVLESGEITGSTIGTTTDMDGEYEITVPDELNTLAFTYVGYLRTEVEIDGRTEINVELSQNVQELEDIVVVGYGTTRKESLTGSVSQVSGRDLENAAVSRIDQSLQGRAPGVQVTSVSGEPGAPASIRIRGGNSIQGNNEPLWVIDGVIVGQNFNLNNINSNDIQSIDVLKDASAVSIYGTRGANGVILVTTKSGRGMGAGTTEVSFNTYAGTQIMLDTPNFLAGRDHAIYANEDAELRGAAAPFSDPNNVPNVNWIDQVSKEALVFNTDLSLTGVTNDNKINYFISGNHFNQDGVVRGSEFKRYSFRTNLDYNISDRFQAGFRLNLSRVEQENNRVNIAQIYGDHIPERAIYNEDGSFTAENPVSATLQSNPEADIQLQDDNQNITNLLGSAYIEFQPLENIVIRSSLNPEINEFKRNRFNPGRLPENLAVNAGGDAQINTSSRVGLLNENTINYVTNIGVDQELDILGGFTWQTLKAESNNAQAFEFSNDVTGYNNLAFGSNPNRNVVGSNFDAYQLVSWLGRVNYTLKNRYLFTLVGRVDGSSRFAKGNRYGFFPSGAFAWILSQEEFVQNLDIFDLLKLRFSFGKSGSQAIPSFRTLGLLGFANTTFNGTEQPGVLLGRPANEDLTWETTEQYDVGLEAAFFEGRLSVELDYYYKKTKDLLLNVQIPRQTGFNSRLQNLGEIQNQGLEFLINTTNVSNQNFQWSSTLTLSGNRNEVLDLGGVDFIDAITDPGQSQGGVAGRLMVGENAPVFVGVDYLGTWKSQAEIDQSGQTGQVVGGPRFRDTNGNGEVNEEDFVVLGDPEPDFIFGIQNTFTFKNWELDFFFQGTYGNDVFNELTTTAFFGRPGRTKYAELLNRWTPENQDSDIPRAGAIASLSEVPNNSELIEDGSHIRLKNLQLTYNVPVERVGVQNTFKNLSVYFSGNNLFVLSNFRLNDPETSMFGRTNVAGGFSRGEFPSARTMSLGVRATF